MSNEVPGPDGNTRPVMFVGAPIVITDYSGTVTTGGTAQTARAANVNRRYLMVANPDATTDLFFSVSGTATTGAGSVRLPAGTGVIFDAQTPTGAVSVLSATTGKAFTVQEG